MEMSFSELRQKEVINTADGRKLGKICDMVFCYPENKILGFVVPGSRSFGSKKTDFFIDLKNIVEIGDDVVLVNGGLSRQCGCKPRGKSQERSQNVYNECAGTPFGDRRSYEEYE